MTTFDDMLPRLVEVFQRQNDDLVCIRPILVNRDLNGRVRLILDEKWESDTAAKEVLRELTGRIYAELGPHAYPPDQALLFEPDVENFLKEETSFRLEGVDKVYIVDRLAMEGDWADITPPKENAYRIVFFSIKGGVGRSTAIAATAWALAERDKRVMVLDLDLESPGLSASLLPADRQPAHGITDWLVEDLVNNGDEVFENMVATSELSRKGEILIVPAHGKTPGEYVAKLGLAWMSKVDSDGWREGWSKRLGRVFDALEKQWVPDVVLIDSRAGIDEVASACLTDLGASTILLFAIDGDQTWSGYRILFQHWRKMDVVREIRERLQLVGAMIPETGTVGYLENLRERAWNLFSEELYDEVSPGQLLDESGWNFDVADEDAPHYPWIVRWHRGFAALRNLHGRLQEIDRKELDSIFGSLIDGLELSIGGDGETV